MNKNLWLLTLSQVFSFTAAPITIFLSGIIGSLITPIVALSTLPTAMMIVGSAVFTVFASKIMSRIGRKRGFLLSAIACSFSSLVAAYSIYNENFVLYCTACFLIGNSLAFTHQYRFAAAESVEKIMIPRAISIIMLAGILSALLGPNLANYAKDMIDGHTYVGSYLALSVLTFIPVFFLFFYSNETKKTNEKKTSGRSYLELLAQPRFLQAIVAAAFAYAIMSFLMTATPISMHIMHGISLGKTGMVIQIHVIAMFLPSLLTGTLVKKYGHSKIMYCGVILFGITIMLSNFEQVFLNYVISLAFLGLGWNFLFISGTSLLVISYKENEKYKAQGLNDVLVFSTQALASLSAGFLLNLTSWETLNLICIPFLILIVLITYWADTSNSEKLNIGGQIV
ncbi:MAG: MFS transporter [Alphaproteobacteria bacterium]|jgi:MFS family permease|tara:strand:+ start:301 stop:1491 length:1191 start_codon:yes stop_codon:yes gene_type:complete